MEHNANVTSIEHLVQLHQAIGSYRGQMSKELEGLKLEIRRLTNWITVDARQYWSDETTKATRHLVECQDALTRCQSYVREDEKRPCTEEKKRLAKAKQRRQLCERMVRLAAAAANAWEREQNKNHAKVQRLCDFVESDLNVAAVHLNDHIGLLESYSNVKSAAFSQTDSVKSSEDTISSENIIASDTANSLPNQEPPTDASNQP